MAVIALLSWMTVASSDAQSSPKMPRVGLLSVGTDPSRPLPPQWLAFLDGLRVLGYVEGQNIVIERRFAAGKSERVAGMATELVQLGVDVIVATGLRENQAARQATTRTPIAKYRLPAIYPHREFAEAGGLMAYGASFVERFRRAATFVAKIVKGAKPADLPVEQPTRFELILNLKTAKSLGLTFPPSLLTRADEVLQ
jgi:ABC-type uncharacterized transport system substrate-binding protein